MAFLHLSLFPKFAHYLSLYTTYCSSEDHIRGLWRLASTVCSSLTDLCSVDNSWKKKTTAAITVTLKISSSPQRYRSMCITATVHPNSPRAAGGTPVLYFLNCLLHSNPSCCWDHSNTFINCNCFGLQCCALTSSKQLSEALGAKTAKNDCCAARARWCDYFTLIWL